MIHTSSLLLGIFIGVMVMSIVWMIFTQLINKETKSHYYIKGRCDNCRNISYYTYELGKKVEEQEIKCPECGCISRITIIDY